MLAQPEGDDFSGPIEDYQIGAIKHLLKSRVAAVHESEEPMVALAYELYKIVKDFLEKVLTYTWMGPNSKLALLGGVMINCEGENPDLFLPLLFEVRANGPNQCQ